jgi:uncharacterized protein YdeI (BOF family)
VRESSAFIFRLSVLFCMVSMIGGSSVVPVNASETPALVMAEQSQEEPAVNTFTGKIVSQNGERFILRDDVNEVWYHLDDQQQAGKFLGKNVSVTGVLDGRTVTIRVRSISEAKA